MTGPPRMISRPFQRTRWPTPNANAAACANHALDDLTTEQQLDIDLAGIAVAVKDHRADCVGATGMTVQMRPQAREPMGEARLPALRDTARSLRAIQ